MPAADRAASNPPPGGPARRVGVSRSALHFILWKNTTGADRLVQINQTRLADAVGVTKETMNRVLARMVKDGRLVPVEGNIKHTSRVFEVADPAEFPTDE